MNEASALLLTNEESGAVTLVFDNRRKLHPNYLEDEYHIVTKVSISQNTSPISYSLNGRNKSKKQIREFLKGKTDYHLLVTRLDINLNVEEPTFIVQQNSVISLPNMNQHQLWDQIIAVNGSLDFEQRAASAKKDLASGMANSSHVKTNRKGKNSSDRTKHATVESYILGAKERNLCMHKKER